ncbi:CBS domain-containing protein [Epibacterium ulvae]|uniref:CBS domain-containing protein n=1 Tax=Epibacterium ulvae TaxID=1156985 RepID=UPI001BFCBF23|nr:CBS domain-containing protein [Epibacterium ulvae]MBT8152487.1 CBS domain-containing protein [Epibacterium ulvae]
MLVQLILKSKANASVFTVSPDATVSQAAEILAKYRIGTVIVSSTGDTAEGILSERDIVRELAVSGAGCLSEPVREYMTQKLVTCSPQDNAEDVLRKMTEGRFRHMPVVVDGKLKGIVTLGDVVKAQLSELEMEKDALEGMIRGM